MGRTAILAGPPVERVSLALIESPQPYDFRLPSKGAAHRRRGSRTTSPVIGERLPDGRVHLLDGHRRWRIRAERKGGDEIECHLYQPGELSMKNRFQIIYDANCAGPHAFGLIETARLCRTFHESGLDPAWMGSRMKRRVSDMEDLIDLADAPPLLARLLNGTRMRPVFAAMLMRRYARWRRTPWSAHATGVVRRLLHAARREHLTLKVWRFYLDFYWPSDRPAFVRMTAQHEKNH